jgi:uncharacterized membrane protein
MNIGPIQLIAITFPEFEPKGEILPKLMALVEAETIRLIDLQVIRKDQAGHVSSMELSGLSAKERVEFGAVIGGLLGAGAGGEEGAVEGSMSGALAAAEQSYGLSTADLKAVADRIRPGSAAALLLIEHTWATPFRDAVVRAGGQVQAQGYLTPQALFMVGKELEAQVEAVEAIAASEAIQKEAAKRAAIAVALSRAIQEEAARRAVAALMAADIIEEAAIEEAVLVVQTAGLIEQAAIEEAQQVVATAEAVKEAAAISAVRALVESEIIQEEARERAVDALVTAALIEAGARDEALQAVLAAEAAKGNGTATGET